MLPCGAGMHVPVRSEGTRIQLDAGGEFDAFLDYVVSDRGVRDHDRCVYLAECVKRGRVQSPDHAD